MQETHILPNANIVPHHISADWPLARKSLGVLSGLCRIQYQSAARHADEMVVQEFDKVGCRIVHFRAGELADAVDPVLEGNDISPWNIKCVSKYRNDLAPWLPCRIFNVVDRIRCGFGDKQVA